YSLHRTSFPRLTYGEIRQGTLSYRPGDADKLTMFSGYTMWCYSSSRPSNLLDRHSAIVVVDCRSGPLARPSLEDLPDNGGLAALVGQHDRTAQALRLPFDDLLAPLSEIPTVTETSPENDAGTFWYAAEFTDRDVLVAFAILNDVSLGRQSPTSAK